MKVSALLTKIQCTQHKDIQHNDTQHDDIQHYCTQNENIHHNDTQHNESRLKDTQYCNKNPTLSITTLSIMLLDAECSHDECLVLIVMLTVIMLSALCKM
jgi:hypothetical protein